MTEGCSGGGMKPPRNYAWEATAPAEELLAYAQKRGFRRLRYRVEGTAAGPSRLVDVNTALAIAAQWGGQVRELFELTAPYAWMPTCPTCKQDGSWCVSASGKRKYQPHAARAALGEESDAS